MSNLIFYTKPYIYRLSTKSLLNLNTKTVPGHVLKHGYVAYLFYICLLLNSVIL